MTFTQFILFIAAALLLVTIPVAGKYFRLLNTLLHEIGHVLASLLSGGGIYHIRLFKDTSGAAYISSKNRLSLIFVALAGYPFASGMSFVAFWLVVNGYMEWVYYTLFSVLGMSLLFWVRNGFGLFWNSFFLAGTAGVYFYAPVLLQNSYIQLVTAILLVESIRSSWVILYLSIVSPQAAGDATDLKKATWITARFWGLLFFLQSLYFGGYLVFKTFFL